MPAFAPSVFSKAHPSPRNWRSACAAIACVLLAACSADGQRSGGSSGETIVWSEPGATTASGAASSVPAPSGPPLNWQTRLSGDTVMVEIYDRNDYYRVERVELVGPNGLTIAAQEINRTTQQASGGRYRGWGGGPTVGIGGWGGSRGGGGAGIGLGFPLGGSSRAAEPPLGTTTTASVRIPDPSYYRQTADAWVVRMTFSDRGKQTQTAVVPAPKAAP